MKLFFFFTPRGIRVFFIYLTSFPFFFFFTFRKCNGIYSGCIFFLDIIILLCRCSYSILIVIFLYLVHTVQFGNFFFYLRYQLKYMASQNTQCISVWSSSFIQSFSKSYELRKYVARQTLLLPHSLYINILVNFLDSDVKEGQ